MVRLNSPLTPCQLSLPGKPALPSALPFIIQICDDWNTESCQLERTGHRDPGQSHCFKLVNDALELLKTINKPLAVLSICGPYRSGKSYFVSPRLLGSSPAGIFQIGRDSMRACTKGIWMATTILECEEFATVSVKMIN